MKHLKMIVQHWKVYIIVSRTSWKFSRINLVSCFKVFMKQVFEQLYWKDYIYYISYIKTKEKLQYSIIYKPHIIHNTIWKNTGQYERKTIAW